MIYEEPRFLPGGDKAIIVEFGDAVSPDVNRQVRNLMLAAQKTRISGVIEMVPTYRSLLVYFDPTEIRTQKLQKILCLLARQLEDIQLPTPKLVEIPTVYGGEYGPDLQFVASYNNLCVSEVVQIHTATPYRVYMIGFMAGFPYLGGISPKIATPRLETPRAKISSGSVGIAGSQTGIYPACSPGGWRLIGRTPLQLFDLSQEPPALFQVGDYLIFVAITPKEFTNIKESVENHTYSLKVTEWNK
jgi:KipI family sensor histidine kinase inhibitor